MSSIMLKETGGKSSKLQDSSLDQGTAYEVFRNNTTAVEVVVKDVLRSKKKSVDFDETNRVQVGSGKLYTELENTKNVLVNTRKGFQAIIQEMRKQVEASNTREAETQAENFVLKLENERLKMLLQSKTKLVSKSKKELSSLRRVLKSTVKSICNTPEIPGVFEASSDTDYEDFESELRSKPHTPLKSPKMPNNTDTFDTTFSLKNGILKRKSK